MNIFNLNPKGTLKLSGSQVPKFERSVIHAAARDGVKIINEMHAVEDPDGALITEYFETSEGKKLLEGFDGYLLHILSKRTRS